LGRDPDNVRRATKEMEITYPVAVDSRQRIWNAFGRSGCTGARLDGGLSGPAADKRRWQLDDQDPTGLVQARSQSPIVGCYQNLGQLAGYMGQMTQPMGVALTGKGSYPGVQIGVRGKQIYATDATQNPKTVVLAFQDLIGQPTWSDIATISFKTELRADVGFMDMVTTTGRLPPALPELERIECNAVSSV